MEEIYPPNRRILAIWTKVRFSIFGGLIVPETPRLDRLLIWLPVSICVGIAFYFSLDQEPALALGQWAIFLAIVCAVSAFIWRKNSVSVFGSVMLVGALCGFAHIQCAAHRIPPPQTEISERAIWVEGWIEAVERTEPRDRLRLRVSNLDGFETPPKRIRVLTRFDEFSPGDSVRLRAVLSPPKGPVSAGSYDSARAAFFDEIGLTGFAVSPLEKGPEIKTHRLERGLARLRWDMGERTLSVLPNNLGGLARALLTGDRAYVDLGDRDALQASGLGHILAISGLHMALFAGGAYWLFRLTFSTFGAYGRIHDPRKPAALAAIFVASLYLVLSGAAVPTQRAWIMTIVVLVGVMLDRRAFTFQSLSIAALIVLAIAPQSVVEVGFQMSFAAVAALIAVYEMIMRSRANTVPMQSAFRHVRMGLEGLVVTSLVAGAATGVFAGFHFQRMAAFGFFANLAAMPIFTFWVMPAGAMALILMPFSMEGVALSIMAPGLDLILQIAHCASSADGARVDLAAPNPVLITIFAFGFALASLGLGATRLVGSAVCLSVLAAWALQSSPELMVTDGGIVIVHESQTDRYQVSSMRGRFDRRVMIQRAGGGLAQPERLSAQCDRLGCIGTTEDGLSFAITDRPEALEEDCQNVALIVFRGTLTNWQKRRCQALVLDDTKRSEDGGLEFWIQDQMLSRFRSVRRSRGQRLWTQ